MMILDEARASVATIDLVIFSMKQNVLLMMNLLRYDFSNLKVGRIV